MSDATTENTAPSVEVEDTKTAELVTTDAPQSAAPAEGGAPAKKKKKKKKKKKSNKKGPRGFNRVPEERLRRRKQTLPPTKTVSSLYPDRDFPEGDILPHPLQNDTYRMKSEEKIAMDTLDSDRLKDLRECAEIHRTVRADIQRFVQPGMRLIDIAERLEDTNRRLIGLDPGDPMRRSIAFPTGLSLNNVAAHYTPNTGDDRILLHDDVMKVDFGTQINGNIIDCAFTMTFNPKYDDFINVVKEATNTGIREMGIDVRLSDIGAAIQEVMEAGEVDIDGTVFQVKSIRNLHGHSIGPWRIHAGKSVPIIDNGDQTKMVETELYAIETFGSTGHGFVNEGADDCSHFMRNLDVERAPLRGKKAKILLHHINAQHGSLAFCRRWLDTGGQPRHLMALKELVDAKLISRYPSLVDKAGCFTAQYEHTILLRPTCKEVLSRGDDY